MEPIDDGEIQVAEGYNDDYAAPKHIPRSKMSMQERVTELVKEATSNLANEKDQLKRFKDAAETCVKNIHAFELQLAGLVQFATARQAAEDWYATKDKAPAITEPVRRIDMEE